MARVYILKWKPSMVADLKTTRIYYEHYDAGIAEEDKVPVTESSQFVEIDIADLVPDENGEVRFDMASFGVFTNQTGTYKIGIQEIDAVGNRSPLVIHGSEIHIDYIAPPGPVGIDVLIS